ncbi:hypothetical protein [Mycobacterium phage WXIN]|nr:hypothetical protein [Mycobacterium phage WXIN]
MTDYAELIARAEESLASVQPGEWEVWEEGGFDGPATWLLSEIERYREYRNNVYCGTDRALAYFIAAAHNSLIPELVAALKEKQEQASYWRGVAYALGAN